MTTTRSNDGQVLFRRGMLSLPSSPTSYRLTKVSLDMVTAATEPDALADPVTLSQQAV